MGPQLWAKAEFQDGGRGTGPCQGVSSILPPGCSVSSPLGAKQVTKNYQVEWGIYMLWSCPGQTQHLGHFIQKHPTS